MAPVWDHVLVSLPSLVYGTPYWLAMKLDNSMSSKMLSNRKSQDCTNTYIPTKGGEQQRPQTNKNRRTLVFCIFYSFRPTEKMPDKAWKRVRKFHVLLIETSPTFWTEHILILRIFICWMLLDSRFPDFLVPRFPGSQISRRRRPGRTLRSQPDPCPNAPRDHIRRKGAIAAIIQSCKQQQQQHHTFGWFSSYVRVKQCPKSISCCRTHGSALYEWLYG